MKKLLVMMAVLVSFCLTLLPAISSPNAGIGYVSAIATTSVVSSDGWLDIL